jgi:hypothetical protein|tara:strand:- start:263 stop:424 length:162 start_codon:yes stop_codon:yes gene_type:complete
MERVTKKLVKYLQDMKKQTKQLSFIRLRKEVEIGKNGTQGYMITKGKNKGTIL